MIVSKLHRKRKPNTSTTPLPGSELSGKKAIIVTSRDIPMATVSTLRKARQLASFVQAEIRVPAAMAGHRPMMNAKGVPARNASRSGIPLKYVVG
jgi:hypothetical protein